VFKKDKVIRDKNGQFIKGFTGYRNGIKDIHVSPDTEFKKGNIPWNKNKSGYSTSKKGSKEPMEVTQKRIKALKENYKKFGPRVSPMKGEKHSEETKRKIRLNNIGKNLGKTHSKKSKDQMSKTLLELHKTPKHKEKMRLSHLGFKHTEEDKRNMSRMAKEKGFGLWMTGKKHTKETIEKIKKNRRNLVIPKQDTKIELKIQDYLTALKIEFVTHKYINIENSYQCDIMIPVQDLIPQKTIIECDGDFFHCNPNKYSAEDKIFKNGKTAKERWDLDNARTKQLIEKGFNVIRLWENEIHKMELNDFKEILCSN